MNKYLTNKSIKKRVDKRLLQLASLHANHGTNSKFDVGNNFKKERKRIQNEIKIICPKFYNSII